MDSAAAGNKPSAGAKDVNDMKSILESIQQVTEAPLPVPTASMPPATMPPKDDGDPVSVNVSMNARGTDHVKDLLDLMKAAGLGDAEQATDKMISPRMDMERLSAMMDEPGEEIEPTEDEVDAEEGYDNEPEEEYRDTQYMTKDLSGGINREKNQYKAAQRGDNAMAVESIKGRLLQALAEKKKPDANKNGIPDYAEDGKGPNDLAKGKKGSKPKKGEVPPQFKKK